MARFINYTDLTLICVLPVSMYEDVRDIPEVQDSDAVYRSKVAAILHVWQFGGRVQGFDDEFNKWTVERRPEECLKHIRLDLRRLVETLGA